MSRSIQLQIPGPSHKRWNDGRHGTAGVPPIKKSRHNIFRKIKTWMESPSKIADVVKIFPNAVSSGGIINLAFEVSYTGKYTVVMFDADGRPILQKKFLLENLKSIEQIEIDKHLPTGNYSIEVINLSTKKLYTNKVLVL